MRFLFCGNLSIPEWFLAESANLSKITAIKLKLVLNSLIQHMIEDTDNSDNIVKTLENCGFNSQEVNAVIASLEFIIRSSICYDIDEQTLTKELIDLGFPKENVEQIVKAYKNNKDRLKQKEYKQIMRISQVQDCKYTINKLILSSEKSIIEKENNINETQYANISLTYTDFIQQQNKNINFVVFPDKINEFIHELEKAQKVLNKI